MRRPRLFDELTHELLDLTVAEKGVGHALYAVNIDCCSCCCCCCGFIDC